MAGKKRLRMRGVKRAPKRLEEELIEKAKNLAENPELIRPVCDSKCLFCPFKKTFSAINKLGSKVNDAEFMTKMASKGSDDIFKAYCGTVSLYAAGNIQYLATAKLAGEDISYAQRGSVGSDKMIGCQYYDDPKIRLFLYNHIAKKKNLHIYSYDDKVYCSKSPNMPEDYLYDTFWDSPYEFPNDEIQCGHTSSADLVIRVKSLDKEVRICRDCAKEISSLQYIISRMLANDPLDDFEVYVEHKYHKEGESGKKIIDKDTVKKYSLGQLNDLNIINSVVKGEMGSLKNSDNATYIIDNKNYGSDLNAFLADVKGTDVEKDAIKTYLTKNKVSVISRNDKASEVLTSLWSDGYNIIESFTNKEVADSFDDYSKINPASTVKLAHRRFISHDIVSKLPVFSRPGPITKSADTYAKAVKVGGAEMLADEFNNIVPKAGKTRSMAKAFADVAKCDAIKCTNDELEFSQFLYPFVEQLVKAEGNDYRDKMNTLLTAMGCGESV